MRIGFLFNHDQIHQVAHSLPVALALAAGGFSGEIVVATTNARLAAEVRRLGGPLVGTRIEHRELKLKPGSRGLDRVFGSLIPAAKLLVYGDNLEFFRGLDLLVVAEKTSLLLKTHHGLNRLKIVHTRHGAGDRAIGFDKASAGFDHVLCSGRKVQRRLVGEVGIDPARISVVGYPKFDLVTPGQAKAPLPGRRVAVYNPHCSPHLSSWFRHGRQVLEQFRDDEAWGMIFAPHVMLFERACVLSIDKLRLSRPGRIPAACLRGGNILFDLGSRASTDMRYTLAADLYLGDVSSQVYEFLYRPRPCVFLNSHRREWRGDANFLHWTAGDVIDDPADLPEALARADERHRSTYRAVQEKLFADSFDLTGEPSSLRAARVVAGLVGCELEDEPSTVVPRVA